MSAAVKKPSGVSIETWHDCYDDSWNDHVKTTARKSFFRRLYEKRYPENSIDFEEVVFARKPA
jgi:hypothetical protein